MVPRPGYSRAAEAGRRGLSFDGERYEAALRCESHVNGQQSLSTVASDLGGGRRIGVHHDFQQCRDCGAGRLLKAGDRLPVGGAAAARYAAWNSGSFIHLNNVLGATPMATRRLFDVALGQQSGNGFFFLPPEFAPVASHLTQSDSVCRPASPVLRHRRFSEQLPCFSSRSE